MARYGHDLQFGVFVSPVSGDPNRPVRLAQVADRAGLDLVTFQDHPYHPGLLDAWTLLSWAAASTSSIRVAPSVLNLALRPPAVVARAATSLDLLSGGRVELGIGAGFFWDAIAAMGVPRLTPGQGVDALGEAIDVIRGIWDVSERSPLRVDGQHHRLEGAKRGPAPAHDIGLWIGGYKRRMLQLTGRRGDGWLPAVPYLGSMSAIAEGNAVIDDAALEAGRSPSEVRRILNLDGVLGSSTGFPAGSADDWAEQLTALALADGVSTFVMSSDDEHAIEAWAHEVAPATRRMVGSEQSESLGGPGDAGGVGHG